MIKGKVTKAVQRFSEFSMLRQGLQSFVRPGPRAACSSKNIREKPMTCWSLLSSLDDLTSAWKYKFPVLCPVDKMPKFCCSHQTLPKTCMFVRKTMGLRRWGYDSKRMTKGYQSALKDKDVSWPHAHSLDSGCWLASMRQAQMPQFQEAISSVRRI